MIYLFLFIVLPNPILVVITMWAYAAVMNFERVGDEQGGYTTAQKCVGFPLLAIGLILNVRCRLFDCPWLFWVFEFPRKGEWLSSGFMERLAKGPDGRRKNIALWFDRHFLSALDNSKNHLHLKG